MDPSLCKGDNKYVVHNKNLTSHNNSTTQRQHNFFSPVNHFVFVLFFNQFSMDPNQTNQTETLNNLVNICNVILGLLSLVAGLSTAAVYKEDNGNLRSDSNNLIKFTFLAGSFYLITICCCMTTRCMIKKNVTLK
jgi:hypothetical protein